MIGSMALHSRFWVFAFSLLGMLPSYHLVADPGEPPVREGSWYKEEWKVLPSGSMDNTQPKTLFLKETGQVVTEQVGTLVEVVASKVPASARGIVEKKISAGLLKKDQRIQLNISKGFQIYSKEGYYRVSESSVGKSEPFTEDDEAGIQTTLFDKRGRKIFEVFGADRVVCPFPGTPFFSIIDFQDAGPDKQRVVDREGQLIAEFEITSGALISPNGRYWLLTERDLIYPGKFRYEFYDTVEKTKKSGTYELPKSNRRGSSYSQRLTDHGELIFVRERKQQTITLLR